MNTITFEKLAQIVENQDLGAVSFCAVPNQATPSDRVVFYWNDKIIGFGSESWLIEDLDEELAELIGYKNNNK